MQYKALFMNEANQEIPVKGGLETLQEIKQMMERSSRFISLSGISGIAAGICALIGAWVANRELERMGWASDLKPVMRLSKPGGI